MDESASKAGKADKTGTASTGEGAGKADSADRAKSAGKDDGLNKAESTSKDSSTSDSAMKADNPGKTDSAGKGDGEPAGGGSAEAAKAEGAKPAAGSVPGKRRGLRQAAPVRVAARVGRSTAAWAKRPSGRLIVPAVVAVLLLGAAGTAGAYLVPEALKAAPEPSATPGFPLEAGGVAPSAGLPGGGPSGLPVGSAPVGGGLPTAGPTGLPAPTGVVTTAPTVAPTSPVDTGGRPADALAGWAGQVGTKVGIPVVAVQAYGYAELVLARTMPNCHLSWTTIAAIAKVESDHGSANKAVLGADGMVTPTIYGLPLDGKGGRQLIQDTDRGALDQDTTYDRAVGPLQFIPATWNQFKVDADNNGDANPSDIDDASLTAGTYLCQGGRDLSRSDAWWDAIFSYNAVRPYAQKVFEAANDYGRRSRS
ncbi:murein transglycosylase [Actinoplanes sp. NPDC049596]|uniref:lytic transglycosylase domain-containing protein n=1 Tax=unclassified Actinoplanes TaxID=2626549 RepID=UPI00342FC5C7